MAVDEGGSDRFAGVGKGGNFELDLLSAPYPGSRNDQIPVKPFYREVLSDGSNIDGMTFSLKASDQF
jgi:hypothetical protein